MNSPPRRHSVPIAVALAAGIFLIDTLSSLHFAVASLYVLVILLGARDLRRSGIIMTGLLCGTLTTVSYLITHGFTLAGAAPLRSAVSFVSIAVTVILVLQGISAGERFAALQRERTNLARFFSPGTVEQLVGIDVPLSVARRRRAAILFADIVGFTAHVSGKPPEYAFDLLRVLLGLMSEVVFSRQGSIDKFLGDGLMAVFGLPLTSSRDATNAACCALEIIRRIAAWNKTNAPHNPTRVAVGIHYGEVIQGDIGNDKQLEFTVIGDAVNLANRVESYCRTLDADILITGDVMRALLAEGFLEGPSLFADEGKHLLRGYREPVHLYSVKTAGCRDLEG
jgi:class 3 adenylate cyclase